jgi:hypothetical protein
LSRRKFITVTVVYLLILGGLAGCSLDRWAEIEGGDYVVAPREDLTGQIGDGVVQRMGVDRQKRQVAFYLLDGSEIITSFVPRDREDWPAGCPTNISMTRMEVLDLELDTLTIGSDTFKDPILVRDCPRNPERLVLRPEGGIGGSGTACDSSQDCIYFMRK